MKTLLFFLVLTAPAVFAADTPSIPQVGKVKPLKFAPSPAINASNISNLPRDSKNVSFRNELQIAIDKGLAWFQKNQNADGTWGLPDYPAQTALPLTTFMLEPSGKFREQKPDFIQRGYAVLLKSVQPDGGIYGKGLANYNTSISLVALVAANDPKFEPVIRAARNFVIGQQAKNITDPSLDGGIGYGPTGSGSGTPDLSNTVAALEALHATKIAKTEIPENAKDLNWAAVTDFIQRCQNDRDFNKADWVSSDPKDKGGFVYAPGVSKAGDAQSATEPKALRSYGSMSYAGLLSYMYADLKKDDPRVVAVVNWLRNHYTLEENPGMGQEGLYYYYCMMAKALSACGIQELEMKDGRKVDWRKDLAMNLINLQNQDGSWSNENGRWMEKDPALVTSYVLIALEIIHRSL